VAGPVGRSSPQNRIFHALCGDVARQATFCGQKRSARDWKVIFCSALAVATAGESELVEGLEGELVQLRESTARMTSERFAMLLEYVFAWCSQNNIILR
jgi:hypothetical protein